MFKVKYPPQDLLYAGPTTTDEYSSQDYVEQSSRPSKNFIEKNKKNIHYNRLAQFKKKDQDLRDMMIIDYPSASNIESAPRQSQERLQKKDT